MRDLAIGGQRPMVICWVKRNWACLQPLCEQRALTEQHPANRDRAVLTERARRWVFEQVAANAAVSRPSAELEWRGR